MVQMLAALYPTKKQLKQAIGQPLHYEETSIFGLQYLDDGLLTVVGPSPTQRKWYAQITMIDGKIRKVT